MIAGGSVITMSSLVIYILIKTDVIKPAFIFVKLNHIAKKEKAHYKNENKNSSDHVGPFITKTTDASSMHIERMDIGISIPRLVGTISEKIVWPCQVGFI